MSRSVQSGYSAACGPKDHTWTSSRLPWVKLADGYRRIRESRQEGGTRGLTNPLQGHGLLRFGMK